MYRLLSANFSRLRKDKVFWLCMGAMLIYSILYMLNGCRQAISMPEYHHSLDHYYFQFAVSLGMFCALFTSMFLGTEYSDGTIRNKIVVGHTRTDIYLANLITVFTATLLMMLVWLAGALVGIPTLGPWQMGILGLLINLMIAVLFAAAFSSIFTFICMLSTNKAAAVLISILLFLGLLVFTSILYNKLNEPEMVSGVQITANGLEMSDPAPNPAYISGTTRTIYEFIIDFLPTGQGLRMWQLELLHPIRMMISSVFITLFATSGGAFIFKRKNLR